MDCGKVFNSKPRIGGLSSFFNCNNHYINATSCYVSSDLQNNHAHFWHLKEKTLKICPTNFRNNVHLHLLCIPTELKLHLNIVRHTIISNCKRNFTEKRNVPHTVVVSHPESMQYEDFFIIWLIIMGSQLILWNCPKEMSSWWVVMSGGQTSNQVTQPFWWSHSKVHGPSPANGVLGIVHGFKTNKSSPKQCL